MADIIKYDMTNIWASAGDVVAPDPAKIIAGWGVEVVPRQWWNWFENRQDNNIAYMLQKGFPEWDATTQYIINKSYVQRNGIVYKATATSTNSDPVNLTSWVRAFADYTVANAALGALTPAADRAPYFTGTGTASLMTVTSFARTLLDDTTNTAARTTLGAQASNTNLTALSGVTAAANALPYFTSTTAMAVTTMTAFARTLLDDADAATMRATLGLGTAAVATVTTSTTDSTIGNLLRVGDWGMAGSQTGVSIPNQNCDDIVYPGVYNITGSTTNQPSGYGSGAIILHLAWANTGVYYQIALAYSGTAMAYRRRHSTSGWAAWNSVTSATELQAALAAIGLNVSAAPSLADLNSVTVTGFNRYANTATNIPLAGASGTVMTTFYGTTYATQLAISVQTTDANLYNRMFTRTMNQGTWGPWKESVVTEAPTINNATLTGTTTVPSGSILKIGTNYTDNTSAALYVNNGFNNGTNGITVDSFAPSISFVDRTTSAGSGRWRQDGNILRFDASADNGANWTVNLAGFNQSGTLGVAGVLGQANVGLDAGVQTAGGGFLTGTTQIGVRSHFNGGADATSAVMGFVAENTVGNGSTTATTVSLIDFQSNTQTINANHTVTTSSSFRANDKTSTQIASAFAFHGLMATRAGVNRWNVYASGSAPNYFNGQTIVGGSASLPAAGTLLQVNGDQGVSGTLTAGTVTATNINATNFTVSGSFNPTSLAVSGNVTAANLSSSGTIYAATGGTVKDVLYVPAVNPSSNSHVWFQDSSGNTTGIVYAQPNGTLTLQAGGSVVANFASNGNSSFNAVAATAFSTGGSITSTSNTGQNAVQIVSIKAGVPVSGAMYQYCGFQSQTTDGTPPAYGFHRAGDYALAMYLNSANEINLMGSNGVNREMINNGNLNWWISQNQQVALGGVGTYAFMRSNVSATFGVPVAAANLSYGSTGSNGGTPAGTWMSLGWAGAGNHTLFVRIA